MSLEYLRSEGAVVRLSGEDGLAYEIPVGRHDLVEHMREHKAEIVGALRAEQEPVTCPACAGSGDAGTLKSGCWPCAGSGTCSRATADALARFAGWASRRAAEPGTADPASATEAAETCGNTDDSGEPGEPVPPSVPSGGRS